MSRRRTWQSMAGKVGGMMVGRMFRARLALAVCAILLVAFCAPEAFAGAKEVYKSQHFACWESYGYYYGTMAIGVRVNYDATNKIINWIKVTVTPYYEIYPTSDKAKASVTVKGLTFKKDDGTYYLDNNEWQANGVKAERTYQPDWGETWWYGYPEVWVYFEVNEGVPESQHRYKWNVQYDFERGYFYVNNNEPGYAAFKPAACPYCKYGKAHPG